MVIATLAMAHSEKFPFLSTALGASGRDSQSACARTHKRVEKLTLDVLIRGFTGHIPPNADLIL